MRTVILVETLLKKRRRCQMTKVVRGNVQFPFLYLSLDNSITNKTFTLDTQKKTEGRAKGNGNWDSLNKV